MANKMTIIENSLDFGRTVTVLSWGESLGMVCILRLLMWLFTRTIRERVQEETGLTVLNPRLCGIKQFQIEKPCFPTKHS